MNLAQPAQYYTVFSKSRTRLVLFSNLENSHQTCSIKKVDLRNFKIFAGKLSECLFTKVAGVQALFIKE